MNPNRTGLLPGDLVKTKGDVRLWLWSSVEDEDFEQSCCIGPDDAAMVLTVSGQMVLLLVGEQLGWASYVSLRRIAY